ncbi:MAG: hypothetical protein ACOCRX_11455, partial [Candidatus Woesearchaeota archaeon]
MLQVAFKGYYNLEDDIQTMNDDPVFYEPGFNRMFPIEFESEKADKLIFLLKKRTNNTSTSFESIDATDYAIRIKDITTGENLEGNINGSGSEELHINIDSNKDMFNFSRRIKAIECEIKENNTNDYILFRTYVQDDNKVMGYLPVPERKISKRNLNSYFTKDIYLKLNDKNSYYVILSPFQKFKEVDKGEENFSYPIDTIFYKRNRSYNEEGYEYEISKYSHNFLKNVISLVNIPEYEKVVILLIDKYIYNDLYNDQYVSIIYNL